MTELMRWRMVGYMAALFIAGAVTGAAVMGRTAAGSQSLKVGRTDEITTLFWQRWSPLELTPDQKEKVAPLIQKASQELEKSHLDCLKQCSAAVDSLYTQVQPLLTPEQSEKLKQLETERREMLKTKYNYPPDNATAAH